MAISDQERDFGRWFAGTINEVLWSKYTKAEIEDMTDQQFATAASAIAAKAYESAKQMVLKDRTFSDA